MPLSTSQHLIFYPIHQPPHHNSIPPLQATTPPANLTPYAALSLSPFITTMPTRSKTITKTPTSNKRASSVTFQPPRPVKQPRASSRVLQRVDTPHPSQHKTTPPAATTRADPSATAPTATPRPRTALHRRQVLDSGTEGSGDDTDVTREYPSDFEGSGDDQAPPEDAAEDAASEDEDAIETEDEDIRPRLKAPRNDQVLRTMSAAGATRAWMVFVRNMVGNPEPGDNKHFGLFQPLVPIHHGALEMIQRTPQLGMLAVNHGGPTNYAKKMSKTFWLHFRKGRTQYNKSICGGFLADDAPHALAVNALSAVNGPMALAPATSHLGSIAALVALLRGPNLHADPIVHKLWVDLHASGSLYGGSAHSKHSNLAEMVDVNYDAYARLELVNRLSYQGYRHGHTAAYLQGRADDYRQIRKMVRLDRQHNLELVHCTHLYSILFYRSILFHCVLFYSILFYSILLYNITPSYLMLCCRPKRREFKIYPAQQRKRAISCFS